MFSKLFHFLADAFHHLAVEQPVLHLLDQMDQIDRLILDDSQQTETSILDSFQLVDAGNSDFFEFSN